MNYTAPMDTEEFHAALCRYPLLVVNFCAPWSTWCYLIATTWQDAMEDVRARYPDKTDGRVRLGQVDCTAPAVRSLRTGPV
jgi:Thioredoxin